jgi:hypothetical protein
VHVVLAHDAPRVALLHGREALPTTPGVTPVIKVDPRYVWGVSEK